MRGAKIVWKERGFLWMRGCFWSNCFAMGKSLGSEVFKTRPSMRKQIMMRNRYFGLEESEEIGFWVGIMAWFVVLDGSLSLGSRLL